jgi:hypothetical protein
MDSWDEKYRWHYDVHMNLNESLIYYLLNVKTPDYIEIKNKFDYLFKKHQWGSIRIFSIFGRYDLLIRAWLHPSNVNKFRDVIKNEFGNRELIPFAVTKILLRDYTNKEINKHADVSLLTPELILAVQGENESSQIEDFIKKGIIIERNGDSFIRFYVSVQIPSAYANIEDTFAKFIKEYLNNMILDQNGFVKTVSLYKGFGFASFLISCLVKPTDYFKITEIPNIINNQFKDYEISTETFLVHKPNQFSGNGKIGIGTFNTMKGYDSFILNFLPEIYNVDFYKSDKREKIIKILKENADQIKIFDDEQKKLVQEISLAFLTDDGTKLSGILFKFFTDLESLLRKNIDHVANKSSIDIKKYNEIIQAEESKKFLSLDQLIVLYNKIFLEKGNPDLVITNHQKFSNIRNRILHGAADLDKESELFITEIIDIIPTINKIQIEIKKITGK